ncbi:hypothetical protein Dsin_032515 [Dipteronia sinensis]|uniref:Uncharacterized protein n=1 Tax=Dipteronia sinensis TaxID=43782 RepID=A0AAD9ZHG6_9ROSI|nr:hypothetical protein Dsin_032515 [Dipteronia sinensis]
MIMMLIVCGCEFDSFGNWIDNVNKVEMPILFERNGLPQYLQFKRDETRDAHSTPPKFKRYMFFRVRFDHRAL